MLECSKKQIFVASFKHFHGKRTQNRFLPEAVNQIQDDDDPESTVVIIGPPTGGQESDLEKEDDEILNTKGLPERTWVGEEVEVE